MEEQLQRLSDVFPRLKEAGLKIKPSKCQLLRRSVQYLGYILSEKGVEVDPGKTACVSILHSNENLRRLWDLPRIIESSYLVLLR